jgi:hypothetical protein
MDHRIGLFLRLDLGSHILREGQTHKSMHVITLTAYILPS